MEYHDTFSMETGMELREVHDGYARVVLTIEERHLNSQNIAHGGALMTMADLTMGAAAYSKGEAVVTLDLQYRFFHAVHLGDHVVAEGYVDKDGKNIKVTHADLTVEGKVVGYASGQFYRSSL